MTDFEGVAGDWQERCGVPSLSVGVFRRGTPLYMAGFGRGTPDTVYQIASLSKHFTAVLAILLAQSGESPDLDWPIAPHMPEMPESWSGITLRHLLSHTAGVPGAGYESLDLARDYTDRQILSAIVSAGDLEFPPGAAWHYSNAGYVLAGMAIGSHGGAFYGDLLREGVFRPLGMPTAAVNPPGGPVGHVHQNGMLTPAGYVSPSLNRVADGGLCLSMLDFARWEAALHSSWGSQVAEMFVETPLNDGRGSGYGLGWFLSHSERGRAAEHDGAWQGFSTAMVRYLDEGTSAVVLADLADLDAAGLALALASAAETNT